MTIELTHTEFTPRDNSIGFLAPEPEPIDTLAVGQVKAFSVSHQVP